MNIGRPGLAWRDVNVKLLSRILEANLSLDSLEILSQIREPAATVAASQGVGARSVG